MGFWLSKQTRDQQCQTRTDILLLPCKNEFAILCMAACDYNRRFLSYDMSMAATTHDSLAHAASTFGKALEAGLLPEPFFINGDNAFNATNYMIIPGGTPELDAFDYVQSSSRMPIECAFGMLVRRFGVLWRPINVRFDRRTAMIGCCMRLHNICIDSRIAEETMLVNGLGQTQPGRWEPVPKFDKEGRPVEYLDTCNGPMQNRLATRQVPNNTSDCFRRRNELVASITAAAIIRPELARGLHKRKKKKKGHATLATLQQA